MTFARKLKNIKVGSDITKIIDAHYPDTTGKTPASRFNNSVIQFFRDTHNDNSTINDLTIFYPYYVHYFPNQNTLVKRLSQVRKVLHANPDIDDKIYRLSMNDDIFNIPVAEIKKRKTDYTKSVKKKNQTQIQINTNDIKEKLHKFVDGVDVYEKILAVLLMTGSRPLGVFRSNFKACNKKKGDTDDVNYICISNIPKKKDKAEVVKRPILAMGTGMASRKIVKMISSIRSNFPNAIVADGQLSPAIIRALTRTMSNEFPWVSQYHNKSSMLRKIYAELSHKEFAPKVNKNVWIQDTLGHANISTSFSYSFVNSN
jgi:hypothetical protein